MADLLEHLIVPGQCGVQGYKNGIEPLLELQHQHQHSHQTLDSSSSQSNMKQRRESVNYRPTTSRSSSDSEGVSLKSSPSQKDIIFFSPPPQQQHHQTRSNMASSFLIPSSLGNPVDQYLSSTVAASNWPGNRTGLLSPRHANYSQSTPSGAWSNEKEVLSDQSIQAVTATGPNKVSVLYNMCQERGVVPGLTCNDVQGHFVAILKLGDQTFQGAFPRPNKKAARQDVAAMGIDALRAMPLVTGQAYKQQRQVQRQQLQHQQPTLTDTNSGPGEIQNWIGKLGEYCAAENIPEPHDNPIEGGPRGYAHQVFITDKDSNSGTDEQSKSRTLQFGKADNFFPSKQAAKANAAHEAVEWLIANGRMDQSGVSMKKAMKRSGAVSPPGTASATNGLAPQHISPAQRINDPKTPYTRPYNTPLYELDSDPMEKQTSATLSASETLNTASRRPLILQQISRAVQSLRRIRTSRSSPCGCRHLLRRLRPYQGTREIVTLPKWSVDKEMS
ncbi:hypothetical protein L228DRAFT_92951 [Xylona heveae TC161]|uniref:DRBM domain-containing protein n=1 Tax=Xylona heveae (strain CBS 132557 / TC161) TaxID=1328760 RepID=A0A165I2G7_XYLHT|nr:hypothetical protein L228DRAFT_92951 [Xylona heveae TC161]KZF24272.1 hypothetical protein L228DRAFT_92951 [Xylona heveae TC161]